MKKKIAGLFAFVMAFSVAGSISAAVTGDANSDGIVNSKDLTRIGKYLMGTKELTDEERSAADMNHDGRINIIDYILEKELLLEGGSETENTVGVPEFSKESGFYSSDFELVLSAGNDSKIYYTTDGSEPTTESQIYSSALKITNRTSQPNVYSAITDVSHDNFYPQNVTKGTVVKAFAVDKDGNKSETVSKVYFSGIDIKRQYNGFPVISITVDPDDFFSYERGIYVRGKVYEDWRKTGDNSLGNQTYFYPGNYTQKGQEWERKVYFELFENDGNLAFSQYVGARISGNATRSAVVKSLKFYARDEYGKKNVKYALIPDAKKEIDDTTVIEKYKKFRMRNGGNDLGFAQFRDNYIQSLLGDRAFETQSSRPAVMFINGEFFGVYTLQEDYCDSYIENNYDINKDNVVIIECGREVNDGNDEDLALYNDFISFAKNNDLSLQSNYEKIGQMMDMQSFIDYQCAQIFIANQDWMNNDNNYRTWRARTATDQPYEDGKWRWMLYDTEYSMSLYSYMGGTYGEDSLKIAMYGKKANTNNNQWGGGWWPGQQPGHQQPGQEQQLQPEEHTVLFYKLLQNDDFKQRFVNTFCDLMNANLSQKTMLAQLDVFTKMYEPVMQEQMKRVSNSNNFSSEVNNIRTFIQNREKYMYGFMQSDLKLGQTAEISVSVNDSQGGSVMVNTIAADTTNGKWTGKYFTDYPVTLKAVPAEGYRFAGWEGAEGNSDTITVTPSQAQSITAKFTK